MSRMAGMAVIVTLDGPAGAGKSTVARRLARALGFRHLDTGALYRAVALACLQADVDPADAKAVSRLAAGVSIQMSDDGRVFLEGEDVSGRIRTGPVSRAVSVVAANPSVRRLLVPIQRAFAGDLGGVVAEGRDMATVVFPDARHKFYLDATLPERARRRLAEMRADGESQGTPETVAAELAARDRRDSTRETAPLRAAEGARRIDTTDLDIDQVVAVLLEEIEPGKR